MLNNDEINSKVKDIVYELFNEINEDNITSGGEAHNAKKKLNEVSYRKFSKKIETVSPGKKISRAINEVHKKLKEINQIIDYSTKIISENSVNNNKFWDRTNLQLNEISKEVVKTFQKIKKIKQ